MTLKEQTKQKIEDTKELILQMIPTRTSDLINDTDYNYGYLDSNLILHLLNVNATLSSSQTIVSSGSTMTINALVTDSDGNAVSNAPVQFYINGTASGNPINTNSNGIATYTYSGTGIGKVKVHAKIGTFQSETYGVTDYIILDNGTTASHNDNLWHSASQSRITRGENYSTVKEDTVGTNKSIYSVDSFTAPFVVDFDIYFVDGDNNGFFIIALNGLTELKSFKLADLGYSTTKTGEWLSLRAEFGETSVTLTDKSDSAKTATKTYSTAPNRFMLSTNGNNTEFRFKNIGVYPL